jgi:hypothetical protein
LFPLLDGAEPLSDRRSSLDLDKVDLFLNHKNEECSFLKEKKAMVQTTPAQFRKNRKIYFETVANVT